ncbi:MAG: purine-nucleoside phosphorylase [Deltaproteobacteria bacterium]|nr:purine-nucleoside phosphorylase [Deltaproteobacteria bacterium]
MADFHTELHEAHTFLKEHVHSASAIGIVLGTGLPSLGDRVAKRVTIPYREIPHFPVSTVETHSGNLIVGSWGGHEVVVLQGRAHYYEGYSLRKVTFPVRVLRMLGVSVLIITNAAGGLDPDYAPGDIMMITDHINLIGDNPLRGENDDDMGVRFPSMNEPYSKALLLTAEKAEQELGLTLRRGVYVAVPGPSLETAAETRFLRGIGADAVGMSTVPEVIAAVHAGMKVVGFSVIANVNIPESLTPAPIEEVIATVRKAESRLVNLIERFLMLLNS